MAQSEVNPTQQTPEELGPPGSPGADAAQPRDRDPFAPFSHLTAGKAERYRRILRVFAESKSGFVVHLRPDDVAAELGEAADERLDADLDALVRWGNLLPSPDTSRVTAIEEFGRRRFLYALTREGEAVEAALATYEETLARRAELQAVALDDIRASLRALIVLAGEPEPDIGRTAATLRDLETVFRGLADNAAAFMASLTRSIETAADGIDGFLAYKERLIDYLQRFIGGLVIASADIARLLDDLDTLGIDRLLQATARRQATDAAPGADPEGDDDPVAIAEARHLASWRARWEGLRRWFLGSDRGPSQAELLRARARSAIPDLLDTVTALHERRAGRSDRAADFRTLARWFAQAPSDADAHRLWRVAFGLAPARHLTVDAETVEARREQPVPPSLPWAQAPPVTVSARLRRTARYARRGPTVVDDRAGAREALARLLSGEREEIEAARRRLATGRAVRLSELELDTETFPLFLRLLGDTLAAAPPDLGAVTEATSSDGTFGIRLHPVCDGRVAEIATRDGTLRGPDHVIEIVDLLASVSAGAGVGW